MAEHVTSIKVYLTIFFALMILTLVTVGVAYVDLGVANTFVALSIAIAKALLVLLYFMHLRYSSKLVWIIAASGFLWLLILFGLTMSDFVTRIPIPGWTN